VGFASSRHNSSTRGIAGAIHAVMKTGFDNVRDRGGSAALALAVHAGSLLLIALSTAAGLLITGRWGNAPVVLLYLLPVMLAAVYAGLWPSLLAAATSALAFNFFFTAPFHTFVIHNPADIVTVVMLFLVAAVCSQLAASVRTQARLASAHAARNATIAGFSRHLLALRGETQVAEASAFRLAEIFDCHVMVLAERDGPQVLASAPQPSGLSPADLAAASFTLQSGERAGRGEKRAPQADWQFHPVRSDTAVLAALGLAREDGAPTISEDRLLLFDSLLDQMALALERARLEGDAREAAALRARDKLRSALLTSIGDDIKPSIKALQSVVRALRRDGHSDRALVGELDTEVNRIERHIDNLVDVGPGDEGESLAFGEIAMDLHRRTVTRNGEPVHLTPKEYAVLAELARHAGRVLTHAQLLRAVWGPAQQDHVDYLRVAVRALRQKLEREPANPQLIVNEPSVGYRLVV
jgi:two-component system sensor histidine kinase KdpD